ncbi:uncharacterized protein K452DRAFT_278649 [Aplosporella prunicola CBS 121167]|uniref:Carboxylic ester hydrolase n=1 Tax=Aplosporella prunicola CBS 121167 TaxID=1176127 RepID=A0A6A6B3U9_9PEZI|nr:uncharacterized protein K452DRAFT_278649 [Aplosporella prunicola CBS 121167]KAF2137401.1 hypothetical protein K452DRAFT_278649 [Aplosporella prunicola CBS 121167]
MHIPLLRLVLASPASTGLTSSSFVTNPTSTLSPAAPTASLPAYGTFAGTTINATLKGDAFRSGGAVEAWLGIPYASQPVGEDRFRPVGAPEAFVGTRGTKDYGRVCVQDPSSFHADEDYEQGEDCLSVNVFRPVGAGGNEEGEEKELLPVLVWIHGGGFVSGSARSFDGATFVSEAVEGVVVVTFNYRLNSLGFLPSSLFERHDLLNLGLTDQRRLLAFVQRYIAAFGGDPARVTLGGRSAGAHSTGLHLYHNYGDAAGVGPGFAQAILQSGSATGRSFPGAEYPLYKQQFATFCQSVGCGALSSADDDSDSGSADADADAALLACLRAAPIDAIRAASSALFNASDYAITWPFQPTRGGPLLERAGSVSAANGTFYRLPMLTTNVPDEAKYYSPALATDAEFLAFLKNLIPGLSAQDLADLEELYPDPETNKDGPYVGSPNATQYDRVSAALTDYMYACAGVDQAVRLSAAGAPVWKALFATNNSFPAWEGVPHTADTKYTWNDPTVQYPEIGKLLHTYFANFVIHGDPNGPNAKSAGAGEGGRAGGWRVGETAQQPLNASPVWPRFVDALEAGRPGLQLRIEPFGQTRVEGDARRRPQCEWWRDEERAVRLEK